MFYLTEVSCEVEVRKVAESDDGCSLVADLEISHQLLDLPELLRQVSPTAGQSLHVRGGLLLLLLLILAGLHLLLRH